MQELAMTGWLNRMAQFLNSWMIRIVVISSFAAHLVLILFAGVRRRKASGVRILLLWLAYQLTDWAATYALGNLSLGSTSREQQLVAFWAPFLLLHLGGPDNITAYSLEDNILSGRQVLNVAVRVVGAMYILYKHIYTDGSGTLLPASIIIFAVGVAKYVERALALWQGNLSSIRSSSKKQQPSRFTGPVGFTMERKLDDEQALLEAHSLFHFCQDAMADSSVDLDSPSLNTSRKIFSFGWESMCKVVEMELSLMYDILYTKAAMVHTLGGYMVRVASPLAIAVALLLFGFYSKDGQRRADVIITYILLVGAFLLDLRWLLRALGSTWTHAFLHSRCWLHRGRWHRVRRVVVSLDMRQLLARAPRSSYRMWSGTIGQYNLLHECTRDETSLSRRLAKKIGMQDSWNEYHYSERRAVSADIMRLVFERIQQRLKSTYEVKEDSKTPSYCMKDITTYWGQVAARRRDKMLRRFILAFGREFQEDILVWHIATEVFLLCRDQQLAKALPPSTTSVVKAIKALSEYLMFLVAVRRHMLPGLVLRSLYEVTRDALQVIWHDEVTKNFKASSPTTREEKLARILRDKRKTDRNWGLDQDKTRLVSDGVNLGMVLLKADESEMPALLELVFNVWVDKLLYAGTRCSRDSHAKQLGRGGELTTIVWILAEHAGSFRIGELSQKPEEKKGDKKDGSPTPMPASLSAPAAYPFPSPPYNGYPFHIPGLEPPYPVLYEPAARRPPEPEPAPKKEEPRPPPPAPRPPPRAPTAPPKPKSAPVPPPPKSAPVPPPPESTAPPRPPPPESTAPPKSELARPPPPELAPVPPPPKPVPPPPKSELARPPPPELALVPPPPKSELACPPPPELAPVPPELAPVPPPPESTAPPRPPPRAPTAPPRPPPRAPLVEPRPPPPPELAPVPEPEPAPLVEEQEEEETTMYATLYPEY